MEDKMTKELNTNGPLFRTVSPLTSNEYLKIAQKINEYTNETLTISNQVMNYDSMFKNLHKKIYNPKFFEKNIKTTLKYREYEENRDKLIELRKAVSHLTSATNHSYKYLNFTQKLSVAIQGRGESEEAAYFAFFYYIYICKRTDITLIHLKGNIEDFNRNFSKQNYIVNFNVDFDLSHILILIGPDFNSVKNIKNFSELCKFKYDKRSVFFDPFLNVICEANKLKDNTKIKDYLDGLTAKEISAVLPYSQTNIKDIDDLFNEVDEITTIVHNALLDKKLEERVFDWISKKAVRNMFNVKPDNLSSPL
jgi:F0F1-type ATP synthase delta subunit